MLKVDLDCLIRVNILLEIRKRAQQIQYYNKTHKIEMIDNFFEENYHSYDRVYQHPDTHNFIYIGDMQSAIDDDFLRNNNIKTVITAAKDMDHIIFNQSIRHVEYPLLDGKNQNIASFFQGFFEFVQNAIKVGNILVHCAAGISRSATLVISFIMKKQKIPFKQAISLVRKSRPSVLPNLGFQRQLKEYEKKLEKNSKFSRNSRRSEAKTSESSKRPYLIKTELLPQVVFDNKDKIKNHLVSLNIKRNVQKYTEKEIQIFKIYHNNNFQVNSKKEFSNRKKLNAINKFNNIDDSIKVELPERPLVSQAINRGKTGYRKRIKAKVLNIQSKINSNLNLINAYGVNQKDQSAQKPTQL